jgi:2-polyprenyl-6-methoxyphenol hydroxylase-like FAD-dependent oxidoreductase
VRNVLIIGGGVAGMSCAIQMRKAGVFVDLIDIDPNWRVHGAGITITAPTLRALQTLGILDAVTAQGATWNGAKIHNKFGELLDEVHFPPLALNLPAVGGVMRPALHRIMSEKTREVGTNVRLGMTVEEFVETDDYVEVLLSDGVRESYDLVVGADGIFSKTRKQLFPTASQPTFTGQAIFRMLADRPVGFDRSHFFMSEDCKIGFNPVSPTHMYMFLLRPSTKGRRIEQKDQPKELYDAMAGFGGLVAKIRKTVLPSNAHSINYRALEVLLHPWPWYRNHVVLIGDAAHATTPHLASGAGMAIEDGIVLAEEILAEPILETALDRFMVRRFERCRLVIENSVKLGEIEMSHGSIVEHTQLMSEAMIALGQPI